MVTRNISLVGAVLARTSQPRIERTAKTSVLGNFARLGQAKLAQMVRPLTGHVLSAEPEVLRTREQLTANVAKQTPIPLERRAPRRVTHQYSPKAHVHTDRFPTINAAWPFEDMKPSEAFDLKSDWRVLTVDLTELQPVHHVGRGTLLRSAEVLDAKLVKTGYPTGTAVPEAVLKKIVWDDGSEGKGIYVSEPVDGRRFVLNGNRRLSALIALVADGRRPPVILTRIPAKEIPFTAGYPETDKRWAVEKMTWGKVLTWTDLFEGSEEAQRHLTNAYAARGISFPPAAERNQITYASAHLYAEEFPGAGMRRKATILDHLSRLQPEGMSYFLERVLTQTDEDMAFVIEPMLRLLFRVPGDRTAQVLSLSNVIWSGETHPGFDMSLGVVDDSRFFAQRDGHEILSAAETAVDACPITDNADAIRLAYDFLYAFQDAMANTGYDTRSSLRAQQIYFLCHEAVQEFQAALAYDENSARRPQDWALSFALLLGRFVAYHDRSSFSMGGAAQRAALKSLQEVFAPALPH